MSASNTSIRSLVDANVFLRLLVPDNDEQLHAVGRMLERAERHELTLELRETVLCEISYVLRSVYKLPRVRIAELLVTTVGLPGVHLNQREVVDAAIQTFMRNNLDFDDALLAAHSVDRSLAIYSFDRHLDRMPGIERREP